MRPAGALVLAVCTALQSVPVSAQTAPTPARKPCAAPEYPREAVRYELQGITTLRFHLAPDGHVADVQVARSSGWALLDEASIRTVRSCGFTPEQAARAKGAALPVQYVWSLDGEASVRPHLVPGSCPPAGRFAGFKPYDDAPSGRDGVKVRLLVGAAGRPRGVKPEGAILPPDMADALVRYVESCRFGFDPAVKGQRTDTAYGRVVFAR